MTDPTDGYPHDLVGDPAPPPGPVEARVLGMAAKSHRRHLEAEQPRLMAAAGGWPTNPRPARSLLVLRDEVNAALPGRATASDGMIGDSRHQDLGSATDHVGWLKVAGVGVVRAFDITNDPRLDLPARFERMRQLAYEGRLPQLTGGGYLILNGRCTLPDFSGWGAYKGADPHVSHGHVSSSRNAAQFDDTRSWIVFSSERPPSPVPVPPAPAPPAGWTGPDLVGSGPGLRGQAAGQPQGPQSNGPRVAELQGWLRGTYPLYAKGLAVDGWYGTQTAGVLREFAGRSGVAGADGLNIGPQLAAALHRAGFGRKLSAAQARVLGHVTRGARR